MVVVRVSTSAKMTKSHPNLFLEHNFVEIRMVDEIKRFESTGNYLALPQIPVN